MLFSIIIPMYNTESTLDRCLSSILKQQYQDFQVILVDDGSEDGSLSIAHSYAQRDDRFFVASSCHGGAGAARNKGLAYASGDYILFMDADDCWISDRLLMQLHCRITQDRPDVLMFQMYKVTESGTVLTRYTKPPFQNENKVLELKDVYLDLVRDGHTLAAAWNKCIRRTLLLSHGILFREDVLGEDIDWVLQLFSEVQTICLLNLYAYAYTQHKYPSRSRQQAAPNDLVTIVDDWSTRLTEGTVSHAEAVAGLTAFEYGICMGHVQYLSSEKKLLMRKNEFLLRYGLDRKTKLIYRFRNMFGYHLTCLAIRFYLFLRRIW